MGARDRAGARSIFVDHVVSGDMERCLLAQLGPLPPCAAHLCVGRYDDTRIQVGGPPESIEREHRWHAQELAEAFMERFPEDPIVFATEDWRGDRD